MSYGRFVLANSSDSTPSFALLDVQGPVIVTYVYQLVDGEVSCAVSSELTSGQGRQGRVPETGPTTRRAAGPDLGVVRRCTDLYATTGDAASQALTAN